MILVRKNIKKNKLFCLQPSACGMKLFKQFKTLAFLHLCALLSTAACISNVSAKTNTADISIDANAFPDETLRAAIAIQADANHDGVLSEAETRQCTDLHIALPHKSDNPMYGDDVSDLYLDLDYEHFCNRMPSTRAHVTGLLNKDHHYDGIPVDFSGLEHFKKLKSLRLHNVEPKNIPLQELKSLEYFEIYGAPEMTLDFRAAAALKKILIVDVELQEIFFNKGLSELGIFYSAVPNMYLDFSNAPGLKKITIVDMELYRVGLSKNKALKSLSIRGCGLQEANISSCTNLEEVHLSMNQLRSINVAKNKKLRYLCLDGNHLTKLDISKNTALQTLSLDRNSFKKLNSNTLKTGSVPLKYLHVTDLSQCSVLDVSYIKTLKEVSAESGNFKQVKIGKQLTTLNISRCSKLGTLHAKTLKAPTGAKLKRLDCSNSGLKKINLSHLKNLKNLSAEGNVPSKIDISKCTKLSSCWLDGGKLKELVASKKSSAKQKKYYRTIVKANNAKLTYK